VWGAGGYADQQGQVDILIGVDLNSQPMDPAYALIVSGEANSVDTVRGELNECSHQVGVAYILYVHTRSMRIHYTDE
jgi:hypothetical protein